jgi:hypothetical protein
MARSACLPGWLRVGACAALVAREALGLIAIAFGFGSLEFQLKPLSGPRGRDELREVMRQPAGPCAAGTPLVVLRIAPDTWSVNLPSQAVCPRR